ncbi:MAG: polar amino acid transport system substrate-binding protein [Actinomycetota bacterium]|nr:polar amino acid transport system substrate-binding protein [Actinomycetota bacterium]
MRRTRYSLLTAAAAAAALTLTGCGGSSGSDNPTLSAPSSAGAPLAASLPQAVRDAGVLKVGSDVAYAPIESFDKDGKTIIGVDPDIAAALSTQLGVKLTLQNGTFDGLITSLRSKRIDLIMSAMSDTAARQKSIDFVDYFTAGTSILVKKGNPQKINSLDDFCGKTIALQRGTTQDDVATAQQAKCKTAGKALKVLKFDRDTEALLQVKQGRAVADMNDFPVAAYNAQTSGGGNDFEVVGEQIEAGPYGIGVRKEDTAIRDALQKALQAIIANGDYAKILEKWNVKAGAVTSATINGGK